MSWKGIETAENVKTGFLVSRRILNVQCWFSKASAGVYQYSSCLKMKRFLVIAYAVE